MKKQGSAALRALSVTLVFAVTAALGSAASAFCGFYVGGADAQLYNNATMVVMMREGQRTVLSMQNNYEGPASDFAMVIPVPQILQEENVRTLSDEVFTKVDQMAAPRLVEYWEQDPCRPDPPMVAFGRGGMAMRSGGAVMEGVVPSPQVRVEAEFEVGEYEIVVLSANDSSALDTWIRQNNYNIPEGAEPFLRPYVESGMYFFVARVNAERVRFSDEGQAMLSPLRFHYDSEDFTLPIRLGLINANDAQDLIVHILARSQRYEVANYGNVTIPTNLAISEEAKDQFGAFYAALFDRTMAVNDNAVVTEYSWNASTCDPCPGPTLTHSDFVTLGADVLDGGSPAPQGELQVRATPSAQAISGSGSIDEARVAVEISMGLDNGIGECVRAASGSAQPGSVEVAIGFDVDDAGDVSNVTTGSTLGAEFVSCVEGLLGEISFPGATGGEAHITRSWLVTTTRRPPPARRGGFRSDFVLTRLHTRYTEDNIGEDLVFRAAGAIVGGREMMNNGALENGSTSASINNFQGRYIIRHAWDGPVECANPVRGRWGGPPNQGGGSPEIRPARDLAFAPRGQLNLAAIVEQDVPEIGLQDRRLADLAPAPNQQRPSNRQQEAPSDIERPVPETGDDDEAANSNLQTREPVESDDTKKSCATAGGGGGAGLALTALVAVFCAARRRRQV